MIQAVPPLAPDDIAHVIQIALAPAFLLSALATLLNVFSARLGRVADKVDAAAAGLIGAGPGEAARLSRQLAYLRRRSFVLDGAVVLASAGGVMTGVAVLTLFVGALHDVATASVLFACFGIALVCTLAAIVAFLWEILMAGRGIRDEVDRQKGQAAGADAGPARHPGGPRLALDQGMSGGGGHDGARHEDGRRP